MADADRMANVLRQAIARFRLDNATPLGLSAGHARMLSRMLIGPEFINHQGGDGQTVSLLGAMLLRRPASASAAPAPPPAETQAAETPAAQTPAAQTPAAETPAAETPAAGTPRAEAPETEWRAPAQPPTESPARRRADEAARPPDEGERPADNGDRAADTGERPPDRKNRPGIDADVSRAWAAARAEKATQQEQPALAERAADLAARIADLIAFQGEPAQREPAQREPALGNPTHGKPTHGEPTHGHGEPTSTKADPGTRVTEERAASRFEVPTTNLAERAEALRRSAARLTANSAGSRVARRHPDVSTPEPETTESATSRRR